MGSQLRGRVEGGAVYFLGSFGQPLGFLGLGANWRAKLRFPATVT